VYLSAVDFMGAVGREVCVKTLRPFNTGFSDLMLVFGCLVS